MTFLSGIFLGLGVGAVLGGVLSALITWLSSHLAQKRAEDHDRRMVVFQIRSAELRKVNDLYQELMQHVSDAFYLHKDATLHASKDAVEALRETSLRVQKLTRSQPRVLLTDPEDFDFWLLQFCEAAKAFVNEAYGAAQDGRETREIFDTTFREHATNVADYLQRQVQDFEQGVKPTRTRQAQSSADSSS